MTEFKFFKYNMLVQEESPVKMKGLQSESGQTLNGKTGVALEFYPADGRWKVKVDGDGGLKKIRIQNLEWNGNQPNMMWKAVAGTMSGKLALGLTVPLPSMDEMKDEINEQFLLMGVPSRMWIGGEDPFDPLKGITSMLKRTGHAFFVSSGGGYSQGPMEDIGIEVGLGGSCARCGNESNKTCIGCDANYCSKLCQKAAWKEGHKVECEKTRREKVVAAWTSYDDKLQEFDRPDGEVKPFVRRDKHGRNAAWDPIIEARIFFDGANGVIDTGLVARHRIKMDDGGDSLVTVSTGKLANGETLSTLQNLECLKRTMVGTPFYEQPFLTTELFKLLEKGQLLGEKLPLTQTEANRELKAVAGRDVNLNLEHVPSDHVAYVEDGFVSFADVICKDGFFVETYFNNMYIESNGNIR